MKGASALPLHVRSVVASFVASVACSDSVAPVAAVISVLHRDNFHKMDVVRRIEMAAPSLSSIGRHLLRMRVALDLRGTACASPSLRGVSPIQGSIRNARKKFSVDAIAMPTCPRRQVPRSVLANTCSPLGA